MRQIAALTLLLVLVASSHAQEKKSPLKKAKPAVPAVEVAYPPELPGKQAHVSVASEDFLKPAATLKEGVAVAKTVPTVDFLYYPGQTYPGNPWSNWGHGTFANGKYYSAIGDHRGPQGNAFVYEYNPATWTLRLLCDVRQTIHLPDGHYTPGKVHSHLGLGCDGWLYFTTHRGSTKATTAANHFMGDWLLRAEPKTGRVEIVERGPVPHHCLPTGELDPRRLIFYGSTAPGDGSDNSGIKFFVYDLAARKMLYVGDNGPSRAMILSSSTGRVYFTPGQSDGPLMRYDAASGGPPVEIPGEINIRAATIETPQGIVYAASFGKPDVGSTLYAFHVKTEQVEPLGPSAIGTNQYVAAITADPTGRYLYYVPGAHGGSDVDNSAVVQYDTRLRQRKVLCCLHPHFQQHYGATLKGTYSAVLDDRGERLFVTWNVSRGTKVWDSCALTVIHIPEAERLP